MDLLNINKFMIPKLFFGNFMKSFSLKFYDCMAIYAIKDSLYNVDINPQIKNKYLHQSIFLLSMHMKRRKKYFILIKILKIALNVQHVLMHLCI
jgi:hypothetical protein